MSPTSAEGPYWGLTRKQGAWDHLSLPAPGDKPKWPCQAINCEWKGEATECPDHGIGAYYKAKAAEALACWREHGYWCSKGCGDSGD